MARACLHESVGVLNVIFVWAGLMFVSPLVGSLLDVPTHTVNMTTLKSTNDLWQSHSMSPYEVSFLSIIFFPLTLTPP